MSEQTIENAWWQNEEIFRLIVEVVKAGKLDIVKRKFEKINAALEKGADVRKINEFVSRGKFNGRNIDELIEQAK
jgi:ribosomal protein L12E/L44/L45/RPP1/RPP2